MTSITSSATNAPSGPVAGVAILHSKLARASPLPFNHSGRVLHWSALTGVRHGLKFETEPLYAGTMLHDKG
jgi:hypothetical protein